MRPLVDCRSFGFGTGSVGSSAGLQLEQAMLGDRESYGDAFTDEVGGAAGTGFQMTDLGGGWLADRFLGTSGGGHSGRGRPE